MKRMQKRVLKNEHVEAFRRYLYEEERSEQTIAKYLRDIRAFIGWIKQKSLEKSDLLEYKKYLCEHYAPRSVNSMLSAMNHLFCFLEWHELKVRALKIQRQIFADREKELTKAEYGRLLTAAQKMGNERLYYLMQTIGSTGVRVSELEYVTCEAVRCGVATIYCKGKCRKVFLPKQLCVMLKRYIKQQQICSGAVFLTRNGKPLDRSNIWKMMKALCEEARVPKEKVFPHNFRHLFARTYYAIQKDIVRLADILGHSNVNTTRIYTAETGEVHQKQIQMLGLLRC